MNRILIAIPLVMVSVPVLSVHAESRPRLLVLAADSVPGVPSDVAVEATSVVVGRSGSLGRFDVLDRNALSAVLGEQALQLSGAGLDSTAVHAGRIANAREGLLVRVLSFAQKGVPTEEQKQHMEDRSLVETVVEETVTAVVVKDGERYPDNIQTNMAVEVRKLNLESGQVLDTWKWSGSNTGGVKAKSRSDAFAAFAAAADQQLRRMYQLSGKVLRVESTRVLMEPGKDLGVRNGQYYLAETPERVDSVDGKEFRLPGGESGLVRVTNAGAEGSEARLVRRWGDVSTGTELAEFVGTPLTTSFQMEYGLSGNPIWGLLRFGSTVMEAADGAIVVGFGSGEAERSGGGTRSLLGFELGLDAGWRPWQTPSAALRLGIGVEGRFFFTEDDSSRSVALPLVVVPVGARFEKSISRHWNLVAGSGWRFFAHNSSWSPADAENKDAKEFWLADNAPRLDLEGVFFEAGIQYLSF